ncbi:GntR family transcriptional regulator [Lutibaculum baratangense]|uniref:Transcriptional regulator, GntR family n=1 Tax=Lutibaculum baratangense AMV1 TaxID=631454 RepID=V4TBB1_9HYPH|nr:GntR family transcriptional regulator [Lutibaculum baratangense]ESR23688.1 Transcriptional regulator, GntR family [Lutibaculum baratangense AMV1]
MGQTEPAEALRQTAHDRVYRELRARLIGGRMAPGRSVTLRGLAAELGVSPMPVREAVGRLVAERALEMKANRRVSVPEMTPRDIAELVFAREALEPEAARRALAGIDRKAVARLRRTDDELEQHLQLGNVEGYVAANHAFHFTIYRACGSAVLVPLIESLWLRIGPFMRVVYGRIGTNWVVDHHEAAIRAIEGGDAEALALAIRDDIREGMGLMTGGSLQADAPETGQGEAALTRGGL